MNEVQQTDEGFIGLGIDSPYIERLVERGLKQPVPVQTNAIPVINAGHDVIVHSATGTGKTLAYLLPLLQKLDSSVKELQFLVIVPTQELAMQIVREIEWLAGRDAVAALIGGAAVTRQIEKLKSHPPFVVGTPGRLNELVNTRKLKLHQVRSVVIDEVDQVFSLGAKGEVESLLRHIPKERQLIFVTATLTSLVNECGERWMKEPLTIKGQSLTEATTAVDHHYIVCQHRDKIDMVRRLIRTLRPTAALIFVNDTEVIGALQAKLTYANLEVESLYGEAGKQDRAAVMQRFSSGRLQLLIATDIAARGLDVESISHVINFDPPVDAEKYVHRSGRTGRMGRSGTIITLVTANDKYLIGKFATKLGILFSEKTLAYGELREAGQEVKRKPRGTAMKASSKSASLKSKSTVQTSDRLVPAISHPDSNEGHTRLDSSGDSPHIELLSAQPQHASRLPKSKKRGRDSKNKGAPRWLKDKDQKST
ncbi:MAG: DEAD/DEAH box helicase [Paenibacillaceae bacterium]